MLEDFCHCLWDTRINSDVVSSDGYEISNLISRDKSQKRKGFLAAGFVKPVVTILLSFPFPVDLYVVNMNLQVGAQRTCGLEIFAASVKSRSQQDIDSTMIISKDNDTRILSRQDSQGLHCYQYDLNINNIKQEFKNLFVQILRVRLPEGKIGHFLNPCFKSTPQVHCNSKIVGNASTNVHKCVLQHGHLLRRTSHLIIRITQVHKGSVPCLGGIEVFGQPAQNSGTFVMNYARLISSRLKEEKKETPNGLCTRLVETNKQSCVGSTEGSPLATLGSSGLSNGTSSLGDHVPEDFIDPITLSIMTLPVLLPSGTTIDQTTLERHIHSEKSWGRPPSDPFTGLALGSKVIPTAALKCRIDNFLLSSDINVSNLGRTVGSLSDRGSTTTVNLNAMKEGRKWQKSDQLLQKLSRKNKCTVDEPDDGQAPSKRHKSGLYVSMKLHIQKVKSFNFPIWVQKKLDFLAPGKCPYHMVSALQPLCSNLYPYSYFCYISLKIWILDQCAFIISRPEIKL